jgi:predicted sulfurtransferase
MSPLQWHQQLSYNNNIIPPSSNSPSTNTSINNSTSPTIILDCRNSYESDVGRFEGAIPLNTTFFRDSWIVLDELLKDTPKDAPILTYCTGGIRCVKVKTCHAVYEEEELIVTVG